MRATLAFALILAAGSTSAPAQVDPAAKSPEAIAEEHVKFTPLRRGSELLNKVIKSNGGQEVGTIRDILVDSRDGQVAFVVIEFNEGVAEGKNYFVVPFAAVKEDTARQNIILGVDPKRVTATPGFDPARWPDMSDPKWSQEIYERFGYEPYWLESPRRLNGASPSRPTESGTSRKDTAQPPEIKRNDDKSDKNTEKQATERPVDPKLPAPPSESKTDPATKNPETARPAREPGALLRVSELVSRNVFGNENRNVGTLSDVVIDMDGRVIYGIVSHGTEDKRRFAAVPWAALDADADQKAYRLDVTPEVLATVSFDEKSWPNMHEVFWARKLHETFAREPYWRVYGVARDEDAYWGDDSSYNRRFAGKPTQNVAGKIVRIEDFVPGRGAARGKLLVLLTDDEKQYTVHLGPEDYLNDQREFKFKVGDRMDITGVPGVFEGSEVMQAYQVKSRDGKVLELRDDRGKVKWQRSSIRGDQNDKNDVRIERDRNKNRPNRNDESPDKQPRQPDAPPRD